MTNAVLSKIDAFVAARGVDLYLLCFALFCFSWGIECIDYIAPIASLVAFFSNIVSVAVLFGLCVLYIPLLRRWRPEHILAISAVGCILIASSIVARAYYLVWAYLFILSAPSLTARDLASVALKISISLIVIAAVSLAIGITEREQYLRGDTARFALGFVHPNMFARFVLCACLSWLTCVFGKVRPPAYILLLIVAIVVYLISGSRTGSITIVTTTALYVVISSSSAKFRISYNLRIVLCAVTILLSILSISLAVFFDGSNQLMMMIDKVLSGRLGFPHQLLSNIPNPLFGFNLNDSYLYVPPDYFSEGSTVLPIDNAFCALLIRFGIIPTILFLGYYIYPLLKHGFEPSNELFFGLAACLIVGMSEAYIYDITFNYFLLVSAAEIRQAVTSSDCFQIWGRIPTGKHFK